MCDIRAELRRYLREHGITQRYLADRVNMSYESMSRMLCQKRELSADELLRICATLGIQPQQLCDPKWDKSASGY